MQSRYQNPWLKISVIDDSANSQPAKADSKAADSKAVDSKAVDSKAVDSKAADSEAVDSKTLDSKMAASKKVDPTAMVDAKTLFGSLSKIDNESSYCYFAGEQLRVCNDHGYAYYNSLYQERLFADICLFWVYDGVQEAKKRYQQRYKRLHSHSQKMIVVVDTDKATVEVKAEFKDITHVFPLYSDARVKKLQTEVNQALIKHDAGAFGLTQGVFGVIFSYISYDKERMRDDLLRYVYPIAHHSRQTYYDCDSLAKLELALDNQVIDDKPTYYDQIKKALLSYAKTKANKEYKNNLECFYATPKGRVVAHLLGLNEIAGEFYSDYKEAEIANQNLISGIKDAITKDVFPFGSNWFLRNIFKTPEHCLAFSLDNILKALETRADKVFSKPIPCIGTGGGGGE